MDVDPADDGEHDDSGLTAADCVFFMMECDFSFVLVLSQFSSGEGGSILKTGQISSSHDPVTMDNLVRKRRNGETIKIQMDSLVLFGRMIISISFGAQRRI